jgi:hypothetical protein
MLGAAVTGISVVVDMIGGDLEISIPSSLVGMVEVKS